MLCPITGMRSRPTPRRTGSRMRRAYDVARDEAAHAVPDHGDALQARRVAHVLAHLLGEPLAARVDALKCLPQQAAVVSVLKSETKSMPSKRLPRQAAAVSGPASAGSRRATCFAVVRLWSLVGCALLQYPAHLVGNTFTCNPTQVCWDNKVGSRCCSTLPPRQQRAHHASQVANRHRKRLAPNIP